MRLPVGTAAWLHLWVFPVFLHCPLLAYKARLTSWLLWLSDVRVHCSVTSHHEARSVLQASKQARRWETNLSSKHSVLQFNTYDRKSPKSMISVMALLARNYTRQATESRGNVEWGKSISSAPFFRLFSPYIFPQTSSNVCKKCWFSLFLWNKLATHNSMHIKPNISKHFTQEQTSLPTSGREIPRCHL